MENKQDYYKVGSKEDIVVSASSLKYIDPEEGGSPLAFLRFFEEGTEETHAMKIGTTIHAWHEDKENFKIAEVVKPSETLGKIADDIIELIREGNEYSNELVTYVIEKYDYQRNWKPETRLNKVVEGTYDYIMEALKAKENNQIFLTASQIEPVINACNAIESHPVANKLLFHSSNNFNNTIVFTELEVYWEETRRVRLSPDSEEKTEIKVKCKAKIDKAIIDLDNKTITVIDLKSLSRIAYNYGSENFLKYKTFRQLSFYVRAFTEYIKQELPHLNDIEFEYKQLIVSVETTKLQQCVVYNIPFGWIVTGSADINRLLNRIAWHQETKKWSYSIEEERNGYILDIPYVPNTKV